MSQCSRKRLWVELLQPVEVAELESILDGSRDARELRVRSLTPMPFDRVGRRRERPRRARLDELDERLELGRPLGLVTSLGRETPLVYVARHSRLELGLELPYGLAFARELLPERPEFGELLCDLARRLAAPVLTGDERLLRLGPLCMGERSVLRHPARAALAGALALAFSAILYRTSDVSPETGAFFRCVYALPVLWALVRLEERTLGPRPRRLRLTAWVAGAFFAADLLLWHHAIEAVGAGLATVLGNTQIVLVGLIAWALFRERPAPSALAAIPIAMVGIVLISGALEEGAYGDNLPLGVLLGLLTGFAYSGFLLTLRHGAGDDRRVAGALFDATLATAVLVLPVGLASGDLDFTPGLESQAWLVVLALSSQVLGWLLITISLPRLPAVATSLLLGVQPVAAVVFAAILLEEDPSPLQLVGAGAILAGLIVASVGRSTRMPESVPSQA